MLAFIRSSEGERLLCVFNFAAKPAKWAIPRALGQPKFLGDAGHGARSEARSIALGPLSSCFALIG